MEFLVGSGMLFLKLIVTRMPCLTRMVGLQAQGAGAAGGVSSFGMRGGLQR